MTLYSASKIFGFFQRKIKYIFSTDIEEWLYSVSSLVKIRSQRTKQNRVLLVEPNSFHGEILPGFCHYFQRLGYSVTILVRKENFKNGTFSLYNNNEKPEIFCVNNSISKLVLKGSKKYNLIVFTSSTICQRYGYYGNVLDYYKGIPEGQQGYILIEHHFPNIIPFLETGKIPQRRIFLLNFFKDHKYQIPMLNPCFFGKTFESIGFKNRKKRIFITVGSINKRNRNIDLLINTVRRIEKENQSDFEVQVIGRNVSKQMFRDLPKQINIVGEINFQKLYQRLQKADFFLPLLDPDFAGHQRYLNGETTGSRQLIMGFCLPPIIQSQFAFVYNFTDLNSILYDKDFTLAFKQALEISEATYISKQRSLNLLRKEVMKKSINNLDHIFKNV